MNANLLFNIMPDILANVIAHTLYIHTKTKAYKKDIKMLLLFFPGCWDYEYVKFYSLCFLVFSIMNIYSLYHLKIP